ncbi:hypothetical protein D1007_33421 [Hordeum vulgare]|nr:hypothetical protein D1007_33421 [Hordeum vulgare]
MSNHRRDRRIQRKRDRRLFIAEEDENAMTAWRERFLHDVTTENQFWTKRRAERAVHRANKLARKELAEAHMDNPMASTWNHEDPHRLYAFTSSDYTIEKDEA